MPRKTDTIAIKDPFLDRRTKMLPCQKEMALYWFARGCSINAIAKMFHVNKRLIQFLVYPERQKANLEQRKDRGGSMAYYDRAEHTKAIKAHRDHKKNLFK